jgi:hypothetical protein
VSADGPGLLVIERILRDRQGIWHQIVEERDLNGLTGRMLASSAIALACYGAVLGAFRSPAMALTSAVKLPLLFLITLAICLPTLYLFNLVFGARLSVRQALALVMVAITVTAMLAVAFAPISLFFLITAPGYAFFKLLNVAILALSALVGLRFLTGGMHVLNGYGLLAPLPAQSAAAADAATPAVNAATPAADTATGRPAGALLAEADAPAPATPALVGAANGGAPASVPAEPVAVPVAAATAAAPAPALPGYAAFPSGAYPFGHGAPVPHPRPVRAGAQVGPDGQRPASMTLLYIWIMLFGFVGTQLAWTLRPFFGSPGEDFALFRKIEGSFYTEIFHTLGNLF